MVAYLWEEMWWLHASELSWTVLQWGSKAYLLLRNNGKPSTSQNLTLEDETPNCGPRFGVSWTANFLGSRIGRIISVWRAW